MKKILMSLLLLTTSYSYADNSSVSKETIIFMRHGEKPKTEIGQLNCKGLNRALKLKSTLVKQFGNPNYIFAPNPTTKIKKEGKSYYYLRPLLTIEPTAVELDLPINIEFGYTHVKEIGNELLSKKYENSTIFVAWEHVKLVDIVRYINEKVGDNKQNISDWPNSEFDQLYIVKITRTSEGKATMEFSVGNENLNNLSDACQS